MNNWLLAPPHKIQVYRWHSGALSRLRALRAGSYSPAACPGHRSGSGRSCRGKKRGETRRRWAAHPHPRPGPALTCPKYPARHTSAAAAHRKGRRSPGSARRRGRTWHAPAPCGTSRRLSPGPGGPRTARSVLTGRKPRPARGRPRRCPPGAAAPRGIAAGRGAAAWPRPSPGAGALTGTRVP